MTESVNNAERDGAREIGAGDIVVYVGALLTFVMMILQLVQGGRGATWLVISIVILMGLSLFVAVAQWLSLKKDSWLMVPYAFAALVGVMFLGGISTVRVVAGADFFILLGAACCAAGTWMTKQNICVFSGSLIPSGGGVEGQLAKLKQMKEADLISEEEYNSKRQELIGKL